MSTLSVLVRVGSIDRDQIELRGRAAWALLQLVAAESKGVTALERVGPRWSAYVFDLRKAGIPILTIHETHGGPFPGRHARYVLVEPVFIQNRGGQDEHQTVRLIDHGQKGA